MFDALGIAFGNLIWQCLAFGLLMFLLSRFAYGPIVKMLDERRNRIQESMDQAEQIKRDNAEAAKRAEAIIVKAQAETREMLAQAQQMSQRTIDAARAEALELREKLLAEAGAQREADTRRAKEELQHEVARLVLIAAGRVIGKTLNSSDHERLVDEALAETERARGGFGRG
ncbi:MAG TPA: F0F1 ATP synthase subunit B [Chloroflexia bacterium]|nr:F0F1 ATP synthase subunit B [Chloroflexia bacterium]